jgi:glycosyltransferase involved in cell wall biosynthesis
MRSEASSFPIFLKKPLIKVSEHMLSVTTESKLHGQVHLLEVIGNASMGGMENYIKNFLQHLPPNQFKVTCICPNESQFTNLLREAGVEDVYITPIADDPAWRSIQLTVEVARLHQIDILHAHMPKAHVLAGLAGCLIDKPVAATIHGMNVTSHELGITRLVGSHLITNCQEAYTQGLAMGVPANRVHRVPNGVDPTVFTPDRTCAELFNAINVPKGTPLIGFVGRLEHEKGPDLFLRAAEHIHYTRPDVHFVIVGNGSIRKQLDDLCKHFQLEQNVHFVGWMDPTEVYPALDLLVHTSRSDGTSLVLLEAMASECPTVGLAIGGVREIIENESTGVLVGAGDWEGIGIKVLELLDQPKKMKNMGVAARTRVQHFFDVRKNTLKIAEVLHNIAFPVADGYVFNSGALSTDKGYKASANNLNG